MCIVCMERISIFYVGNMGRLQSVIAPPSNVDFENDLIKKHFEDNDIGNLSEYTRYKI